MMLAEILNVSMLTHARVQDYVLDYTIQFPHHFKLLLSPKTIEAQRFHSSKLLASLLTKNENAINLLQIQCLP